MFQSARSEVQLSTLPLRRQAWSSPRNAPSRFQGKTDPATSRYDASRLFQRKTTHAAMVPFWRDCCAPGPKGCVLRLNGIGAGKSGAARQDSWGSTVHTKQVLSGHEGKAPGLESFHTEPGLARLLSDSGTGRQNQLSALFSARAALWFPAGARTGLKLPPRPQSSGVWERLLTFFWGEVLVAGGPETRLQRAFAWISCRFPLPGERRSAPRLPSCSRNRPLQPKQVRCPMVCTGKQGNPWAEVFVDIPARIGYIHPPLKLPGVRFLHTGLFPGRAGLSVPLGPVAYGTALSFFLAPDSPCQSRRKRCRTSQVAGIEGDEEQSDRRDVRADR